MTLLKKRKVAVLITVVVAVLATLLGVGRSLNRLARDVEGLFYADRFVDDAGNTWRGIKPHLDNCENAAFSLAMVFVSNSGLSTEANELRASRELYLAATGIQEMYVANERMKLAFDALTGNARNIALTDRENDALTLFSREFRDAQTAINRNPYNDMAASFMDDASFIAQLIRPLAFVTPPGHFGRSLLG